MSLSAVVNPVGTLDDKVHLIQKKTGRRVSGTGGISVNL